jgi:hypothetical protein
MTASFEWLGRALKAAPVGMLYEAFQYEKGSKKFVVKVGDVVFMESGKASALPFVGLVCKLWDAKREDVMMVEVRWFYRLTDVTDPKTVPPNSVPHELFLSKHVRTVVRRGTVRVRRCAQTDGAARPRVLSRFLVPV